MRVTTLIAVMSTAIVVALACGPQQPPRSPRVEEITALWTQIRDWRQDAGWPVDPPHEDVLAIKGKTVDQISAICRPPQPEPQACADVCSLAEAICDNAEQICILADELGKNDDWAQRKCMSAKASCRDSKKKCCQKCSEPPKATMK